MEFFDLDCGNVLGHSFKTAPNGIWMDDNGYGGHSPNPILYKAVGCGFAFHDVVKGITGKATTKEKGIIRR